MMDYLKVCNCDPEMYKGIQNSILLWTGEMKGWVGIGSLKTQRNGSSLKDFKKAIAI